MKFFDSHAGMSYAFRRNAERSVRCLYFRTERMSEDPSVPYSTTWQLVATRNSDGFFLACGVCSNTDSYRRPCETCGDTKEQMRRIVRRARKLLKREKRRRRTNLNGIRHELRKNLSNENEEGDCSICLETYKAEDLTTKLTCNHLFHSTCIAQWIRSNKTCPYCRASVEL